MSMLHTAPSIEGTLNFRLQLKAGTNRICYSCNYLDSGYTMHTPASSHPNRYIEEGYVAHLIALQGGPQWDFCLSFLLSQSADDKCKGSEKAKNSPAFKLANNQYWRHRTLTRSTCDTRKVPAGGRCYALGKLCGSWSKGNATPKIPRN